MTDNLQMTNSIVSYGWDLAGYGSSGSAFCRATRKGSRIDAVILSSKAICRPCHKIDSSITDTVELEVKLLQACGEKRGRIFIDVPIHMQSLSSVVDFQTSQQVDYYWQLVKRPVDHVFAALEPLASNLGFATARIANILGRMPDGKLDLERNLFETYPAATLDLLAGSDKWTAVEKYKGGKAQYQRGWQGIESEKDSEASRKKEQGKNDGLAALASRLELIAQDGFMMNDDEFDAILCAATGCLDECWLWRESLAAHIRSLLAKKHPNGDWSNTEPPPGYVVFNRRPDGLEIHVRRIECETAEELLASVAPVDACDGE
jgi:hypothetical protein